ncbi:hypothetical protein [Haladaptatus sp. NG-SE-30]
MSLAQKHRESIHPKALDTLRALVFYDGRASTKQITDYTDHGNNVLHYWFDQLIQRGWIERTDEVEPSRGPIPAHVYAITDEGRDVVEEHRDENPTIESRLVSLETRVDDLVDENSTLRDQNELLRDRLDTHEERLEDIRTVVKRLYGKVFED